MPKIFCMSGMGADERIFLNFEIKGFDLVIIKWLVPENNESIADYAKRLLPQISDQSPILLGVSFGGVMCLEISKLIHTSVIIIISSIKSRNEMPGWMKIVNRLHLHRFNKVLSTKIFEPIQNYNLGATTNFEKEMARNYRKNVDPTYLKWGISVILKWKFIKTYQKIIHIHGDNDKLFPIKKIQADYIIRNGGHLMIFNRSKEVNAIVNKILLEHNTVC